MEKYVYLSVLRDWMDHQKEGFNKSIESIGGTADNAYNQGLSAGVHQVFMNLEELIKGIEQL